MIVRNEDGRSIDYIHDIVKRCSSSSKVDLEEKDNDNDDEDLDPTRNDSKWKETLHIIEQCAIHHVNRHVSAASIGLHERLVHSAAASVTNTTTNNNNNNNNNTTTNNNNNNNNEQQQQQHNNNQFQVIHSYVK